MKTNEELKTFNSTDVYSDVDTSYSAARFTPDVQEFSLQSIQEKLGTFTEDDVDETSATVNADVMPTEQTLTMSYQRNYKSDTAVQSKVGTKTKVLAVCYVAAVLILVLGIALTAVSVNGIFDQTVQLNADYDTVVNDVAALDAELAEEDFDALAAKAAELGYIQASQSNTQTYTEVETRPAQNFDIQTNWFDSLCDWLCGVFGG